MQQDISKCSFFFVLFFVDFVAPSCDLQKRLCAGRLWHSFGVKTVEKAYVNYRTLDVKERLSMEETLYSTLQGLHNMKV